jgi:hypothetical protein
VLALDFSHVEDAADVGMGDLARRADLVEEAFQVLRVLLQPARQELECHRLSELEVVRPVDLTHAPATEQTDDAVSPGEHGAREKSLARSRVDAGA